MTESEKTELLNAMKRYREKATSSKEAARKVLMDLGIVDKNGKRTIHYKNLCIP